MALTKAELVNRHQMSLGAACAVGELRAKSVESLWSPSTWLRHKSS